MLEIGGSAVQNSFTRVAARKLLDNLSLTGAIFETVDVKLYTAGPDPNPSMVFADFTEATFTGYAAVAGVTFDTASWDDDAAHVTTDALAIFNQTGTAVTNTVIGWMLTTTTGGVTVVHYAEKFDEPKVMAALGDKISVLPNIGMKSAA